ncbi:MAG: YfhO family protein [Candidatus Omnitrophica bacterium]|jgi:uncharacterized membrane protein YfhO|nr:YfhO family protein [Candidatus Omnitrophota bacterium]
MKNRATLFYLLSIFIITIAPFAVILSGKPDFVIGIANHDVAELEIPLRSLQFSYLLKGIITQWNPYLFSGIPAAVDCAFYPLNIVHLFLNIPTAINLLIMAHLFLGALFMFFFLKKITKEDFSAFIGALIFSLSSIFITRIFAGHLSVLINLAWLPCLFLLTEKSITNRKAIYYLLLTLVWAISIIGGHIQFSFITAFGIFIYTINLLIKEKTSGKLNALLRVFLIPLAFGIGIAAFKIFLLKEQSTDSLRIDNNLWNFSFSMPPENIAGLFSPGFFGWPQEIYWGKWNPWESSIYIGMLPLFLTFFAFANKDRHARIMGIISIVSLILAMGPYLPFYSKIFKYLLGVNIFRSQGRFLCLTAFSLSTLASIGCKKLLETPEDSVHKVKTKLYIIFIAMVAIISFFLVISLKYTSWHEMWRILNTYEKLSSAFSDNIHCFFNFIWGRDIFQESLTRSVILSILSLSAIILLLRKSVPRYFTKTLFSILILVDLLAFSSKYYKVFSYRDLRAPQEAFNFLKKNTGQNRILVLDGINLNSGMLSNIPSMGGYYTLLPKHYNRFINFTQNQDLDSPLALDNIQKFPPLFALVNLKYIISSKPDLKGLTKTYSSGPLNIFETNYKLPKAFIAHKAIVKDTTEEILNALNTTGFNFRETVIIEKTIPEMNTLKESLSPETLPEIVSYDADKIIIKASLHEPGILVLCDNYNPNWQAQVNGIPAKVFPVDYILRAVFLPKGEHTVIFTYKPLSFRIGISISALFLIIWIITLARIILCEKKH